MTENVTTETLDQVDFYRHDPLKDSEIRLIRLNESRDNITPLTCELIHFQKSESPLYLALSYVWGNPKETRSILINGKRLEITVNLFNALTEIRRMTKNINDYVEHESKESSDEVTQAVIANLTSSESIKRDVLFWADAICLDQKNVNEKQKQVPLMGSIYSSAFVTLVYMDLGGKFEPSTIRWFCRVAEAFESDAVEELFSFSVTPPILIDSEPPVVDLSSRYDLSLSLLENFFSNEWFSRIWVMQEVILSKRSPIVLFMHGSAIIQLESLISTEKFFDFIQNIESPNEELAEVLSDNRRVSFFASTARINGSITLRQQFQQSSHQGPILAEQLENALRMTSGRLATVDQDYIYGILSLCISDLPVALQPDYSIPFVDVSYQYFKYIVDNSKSLILMESYGPPIVGMPSWLPDLRRRNEFLSNDPDLPAKGEVIITDQFLTVFGTKLGTLRSFTAGIADSNFIGVFAQYELDEPIDSGATTIHLDDGSVVPAFIRNDKLIVRPGNEAWALMGSSIPTILYPTPEGYVLVGHCANVPRGALDKDFFSERLVEKITLI
jgi:Heterokaryon incompatibility protein (HET)